MGRSSLRESLRALEALGIVRVVAGKGIFVADAAGSRAVHEYFVQLMNEKVTALEELRGNSFDYSRIEKKLPAFARIALQYFAKPVAETPKILVLMIRGSLAIF